MHVRGNDQIQCEWRFMTFIAQALSQIALAVAKNSTSTKIVKSMRIEALFTDQRLGQFSCVQKKFLFSNSKFTILRCVFFYSAFEFLLVVFIIFQNQEFYSNVIYL